MTEEKAIETMRALAQAGYIATLTAAPMGDYVGPDVHDGIRYSVQANMISADKVDIRALVEIADELDLDCGWTPIRGNGFTFGAREREHNPVVDGPRKHPRPRKKG